MKLKRKVMIHNISKTNYCGKVYVPKEFVGKTLEINIKVVV